MVALRTRTPTNTATPITTDPSYYRRLWAARGRRTDINSHTHTRRRPRERTYQPAVAVCDGLAFQARSGHNHTNLWCRRWCETPLPRRAVRKAAGPKPPEQMRRPARSPRNKPRNVAGPKPPEQRRRPARSPTHFVGSAFARACATFLMVIGVGPCSRSLFTAALCTSRGAPASTTTVLIKTGMLT